MSNVPGQLSESPSGRGTPASVERAVAHLGTLLAGGAKVALACDESLTGMLGATGIAYLAHAEHDSVRLVGRSACQRQLGEEVIDIPSETDDGLIHLARRVFRGYRRHISGGCAHQRSGRCPASCVGECAHRLVYAAASCEPYAPEVLHRYLRLVFERGGSVRDLVSEPRVVAVDELARLTLNECERTRQFVRFSLVGGTTLAAVFRPRCDTIPLTANHFARRLARERFCVIDPVHLVGAFHEPSQGAQRCDVIRLDKAITDKMVSRLVLSDDERSVQALWRRFYERVSLPGRDATQRGYDLRTRWMPKRFWDGLTELTPQQGPWG